MQNFHIFLTSFIMFNILIQNKSKWHSDMIEFKSLFRNSIKTFNIKWRKITWWQILKFKIFSKFRQSCAYKNMHADLQLFIGITHSVYTTIKLIRKLVRVTSVCKRRWFTSRCHNISFWKLITTLLFRNMQQWSNIWVFLNQGNTSIIIYIGA